MLFSKAVLDGIAAGEVDVAFRRWRRRMHAPGGIQRTAIGVVAFDTVEIIDAADINDRDVQRSGFADRAALLNLLDRKPEGDIYRISLRLEGPDHRVDLREQSQLSPEELVEVARTLATMDARSRREPWTRSYLELIEAHPAERAEDLAIGLGLRKLPFKADIRKLKELGLTESLPVGYRLSPRGQAVLSHLRSADLT